MKLVHIIVNKNQRTVTMQQCESLSFLDGQPVELCFILHSESEVILQHAHILMSCLTANEFHTVRSREFHTVTITAGRSEPSNQYGPGLLVWEALDGTKISIVFFSYIIACEMFSSSLSAGINFRKYDPLLWWRNHESYVPTIAKPPSKYLCIFA